MFVWIKQQQNCIFVNTSDLFDYSIGYLFLLIVINISKINEIGFYSYYAVSFDRLLLVFIAIIVKLLYLFSISRKITNNERYKYRNL